MVRDAEKFAQVRRQFTFCLIPTIAVMISGIAARWFDNWR